MNSRDTSLVEYRLWGLQSFVARMQLKYDEGELEGDTM
jgi:hypothetical protein